MSKVEGDPVLGRGHDLPDTVLVWRIQVRKWWRDNGSIWGINDASTGILALLAIRVEFESNPAFTSIASKSIDTLVFTSMRVLRTLIKFLDKSGGETSLLYRSIRDKSYEHLVWGWSDIFRNLVSTVLSNDGGVRQVTVSNLQVVVDTCVMVFNFKRLKLESNLIPFSYSDLPNTILTWSVILRVVWTL